MLTVCFVVSRLSSKATGRGSVPVVNSSNGLSTLKAPSPRSGKDEPMPYRMLSKPEVVELRKQHMAPNQVYFFKDDPLLVMRSRAQYLYDEFGNEYLDCINNVAHIGHCHPYWASAVGRQLAEQATNVRYLHPAISELAERIASSMPKDSGLSVTYFVNSGSEAIDLALRIARAHTGGEDVVVLDGAYHGTLTSTTAMSPYKYRELQEAEKLRRNLPPEWVHIAPCPDPFRGKYRDTDVPAGTDVDDFLAAKYSDDIDSIMTNASERGRKFGLFIAESIQSCGGQVVYPRDFMRRTYAVVRKHGGLCIADEVQCGFYRVGDHFWGWQTHEGAIPDIVIIGKSMGNGFPVAGVVTRPDIAASFTSKWPEYFNTFGGNPVAATASLAVMDVIESERLGPHAAAMGRLLEVELGRIAAKYPEIVGQIRGRGLMYGIDIITDPATRNPNTLLAVKIKNQLRLQHRIIISTDGPFDNVLKIKPPMCFSAADVKHLAESMEKVIAKLLSKD